MALLSACSSSGDKAPDPGGRLAGEPPGGAVTEQSHGPLNPLPFDTGPVPQLRGQDKRIAELPSGGAFKEAIPPGTQTLVLYDDTGPYGWLGELYAVAAGNLASHFGGWHAEPVAQYMAGQIAAYTATVYIGSTYDQALPVAFLDDVLAATKPVIWMYDNIWQLANRAPTFAETYGYNPWMFDFSSIAEVDYKGRGLTRYATNGAGIMTYSSLDANKATVLAEAVKSDATTFPWALRSQNLTYVGEIPFAYITENDRYLAFCDLLFDALAPATVERHRALVRIEDVHPETDPTAMRAIADYLASASVPFSVAVIPVYVDPNGVYDPSTAPVRIQDRPRYVSALRYMVQKGGTLIMHGYTHQYSNVDNPYTGVTADDFEFWISHIDAGNNVVLDGPVPEDSAAFATARIQSGLQNFAAAGLAAPKIFEYPHYAGSAADSRAIRPKFATVYHRGLYFGGALTREPDDYTHVLGEFYPYVVTDTYGWKVLPENLGSYEPVPYNNHPVRLPADIVASAQANLVVRDGFASVYFHPYYEVTYLQQIVTGIKALGYGFVAPGSL